ncbi:isochorismatase family protein [Burkholderia multivorans]|uniref:isochorismatase family protein n=1 Tax=Burkholderia multivorans TaxID=87883 RepID=UPI000D007211|nr:isochorismatase family protein [Burkholderia multivorans]MBY4673458.1 isochorismatase family protein [Burkholderia multivorans]MCL4652950.1 isochorismatase family protein [Burkholderia multivorans]MCL4656682.1 isochorismatase family protein [Burkholderia multivorans]MCO1427459.1 isochorismatase family protein [Burkholderia multivorans]MDN7746429.1 isochorismatase family protein [Burkholderia multivorans]
MTDTAVIVVDMQHGLVQRATPAYRLDDVVSGINRLTAAARAARAPVCFVQHDGDAADDIVPGTPGWELHRGLVVEAGDWRIRKRMSDAFHDTPLAAQLDRHGVRSVLICGYATEFCVDAAARRATLLGYRTTVVSDLHTTNTRAHLSAEQIVAHHHFIWENSSLSGNAVTPRPLADVLATELA